MGPIVYAIAALVLVAGVSLTWFAFSIVRAQVAELKAELQTERTICGEWKLRYQQLVEDVRKQANQPRSVPAPEAKPMTRRANSSAEIRREFDRINAKVLADHDQAAS